MSFASNRVEAFEGPDAPVGQARLGDLRMWASLSELKVKYQVEHPFRTIWRERAIFADAAIKARDAFVKAGAVLPVLLAETDVKVQEYPAEGVVVFIFRRLVAGKEYLVPVKYELSPSVIGFLRVTNRWSDEAVLVH